MSSFYDKNIFDMKKYTVIGFILLGPVALPQEQWRLIYGSDTSLSIGTVFMVDTIHIWGESGGSVYFSPDWGKTWEEQYHHENYQYADVFFTDSLSGWVVGWSELLHTADGGKNWALQSLPNPLGLDMNAVYFLNPDTGWVAGSYRTVFVTYDGGNDWLTLHHFVIGEHYFFWDVHFYDVFHGCAIGNDIESLYPIIMTTADGGQSWSEAHPPAGYLVDVQFLNESMVWCCDRDGKLFLSKDGGFNWITGADIPYLHPVTMFFFNDSEAFLGGSTGHTARTTDGWESYRMIEMYFSNAVTDFSFTDDYTGIAAGIGNSLRTTDGGVTWKRVNDRFTGIAFFNSFNGWIVQEYPNKNFMHSGDGGVSWTEMAAGNKGNLLHMDIITEETGFAVTDHSELLKTFDAGVSWEVINMPFDSVLYTDMQFLNADTGFLCAAPNRFFRTVNGGQDWETYIFDTLRYLADICFLNHFEGWAVGVQGFAGHTTDGGRSWSGRSLPEYDLSKVQFTDRLHGYILSFHGKVFRTVDGGTTWTDLGVDFVMPQNMFFYDTRTGLITDYYSVYRTHDAGDTWEEELNCHSSNFSSQITGFFSPGPAQAWICTMDGRIYAFSPFAGTVDPVTKVSLTCYPNPFTDFLTIEFGQTVEDDLKIQIFTADGRLVRSGPPVNRKINKMILNVRGLTRGLYLLNVRGAAFSESRKIVRE